MTVSKFILVLLFSSAPFSLQAQTDAASTVRFHSVQPSDQFVVFDAPVEIDWEDIVPDSIRFIIEKSGEDQIL